MSIMSKIVYQVLVFFILNLSLYLEIPIWEHSESSPMLCGISIWEDSFPREANHFTDSGASVVDKAQKPLCISEWHICEVIEALQKMM